MRCLHRARNCVAPVAVLLLFLHADASMAQTISNILEEEYAVYSAVFPPANRVPSANEMPQLALIRSATVPYPLRDWAGFLQEEFGASSEMVENYTMQNRRPNRVHVSMCPHQ